MFTTNGNGSSGADVIRTKRDFYGLYNRGLIGNMLRNWTWEQWAGFADGGYPTDVIAVRNTVRAGAPMCYTLEPREATSWVRSVCASASMRPEEYQFSELAPDHLNTLQGEVMRDERYLYLRYTLHSHERMRFTMDRMAHVRGLTANMLLRRYLDPVAWDTLQYVWDRWEDAIVEFCCYEKQVGTLGSNTLFWEARTHY